MKTAIRTSQAPQPVTAAYSQAIKVSGNVLIFCTGQTSRDPQTGEIVHHGDVEQQTRQALKNLKSVIEAAGGTLEDVVRLGIFYRDVNDVQKVAAVRQEFFPKDPPCSTGIGADLVDAELLVEVDAIAVLHTDGSASMIDDSP